MKECFDYANKIIVTDLAPEVNQDYPKMVGEWQAKAIHLAELVQKECNEFGDAREKMRETFEDDPDFRRAFIDNISCILMDNLGIEKQERDLISSLIMDRIFND